MAIESSEVGATLLGRTHDAVAPRAAVAATDAPSRTAVQRRTMAQIYAFSALFWAAMFAIHTTQMMLANDREDLRTLTARAGMNVLAFLLCVPLGALIRRTLDRPLWPRLLLVGGACAPIAVVYAAIATQVWTTLIKMEGPPTPFVILMTVNAMYYYILFVLWSAFCAAILIAARLQERERSLLAAQALAHQAELKMLRYQINPHFLFNTLNAVSALIVTGQTGAAEEMVGKLSRFFRNALSREASAKVTLAEDVRVQLEYLSIELTRFPDRLSWAVDIEPGLEQALVPHLILQPLFENAIKHGVARSNGAIEIRLTARRGAGSLFIDIANDVRSQEGDAPSAGVGVGLTNVARRLESFYGDEARLSSERRDGRFEARLRLPLEFSL